MFILSLIFETVGAVNAISSRPWSRRASLALKVLLFTTAVLVLLLFLSKGTSSLAFRHTLKTGLIMTSCLWSRPTSPSSISWLNWMLKWLKGLKCVLALVGLRKASRPALTSFAWRRNAVLIAGSLQFGMMMGPLSRLLMIFAFHFHLFAHLFLRLRPLMLLLRSLCLVMSCLRFPLTSLTRVRVY